MPPDAMNVHPRHLRGLAPLLWLASLAGAASGCGNDGGGEATTPGGSGSGTTLDSATGGDATNGSTGSSSSSTGSTNDSSTTAAVDDTTPGSTLTATLGDTTMEDPTAIVDTPPGGTIIPLYTYPTDPTWDAVITAKLAYPEVAVVAIVNPNSGPGTELDPSYDSGITALQDAGVMVIGYVYTSYADRPPAAVQTDISTYATFYPQLDGIMLDEMSNVPGDEAYYADLSEFASDLGLGFTVGNPGTNIPQTFANTVDVLFVYEGAGLPDLESLDGWLFIYERERFAIIPHSVESLDAGFVSTALFQVGWIYATDDVLPNPWDTLPSYFDELMQQLAAG